MRDYDVMCMIDEDDAYIMGAERAAHTPLGEIADPIFADEYTDLAEAEDFGDSEIKDLQWTLHNA